MSLFSLNRKHVASNRSPICSNFQGQFKSTVTCEKCNHSSYAYETFMYLSLPIPHALEPQIAVTWIPAMNASDNVQPVRYLLIVEKSATVNDLFDALLQKLNSEVSKEDIAFAEVTGNAVCRFLDGSLSLQFIDFAKHEVVAFQHATSFKVAAGQNAANVSDAEMGQFEKADGSDSIRSTTEPSSLLMASGVTWHSCTICLEEMFDDELSVHQPCGGALCDGCFQATTAYHNNSSFSCPVCSVNVSSSDFVKNASSASPSSRIVTIPRLLRCPSSSSSGDWKSKNLLCGLPSLVRIPNICHYSALRLAVEESLPSSVLSLSWQLIITDASGLMCSHCDPTAGCFGCELEQDKEIRLKAGDSIVVHIGEKEDVKLEQDISDDASMASKRETDAVYLEECLDAFTQTEYLGDDNPWFCSACDQNRSATKTMTISRLPNVLIVHLKRFYFNETVSKKLINPVIFPTDNLYVASNSSLAADEQRDTVSYCLLGIINHVGSLLGGHYTARTKHPQTKEWHLYSDDVITTGSSSQEDREKVYLLFYERKDATS